MAFRASVPYALILLFVPVWALYLWSKSQWAYSRGRKRLIGALRFAILTCLVLAIAGAEMHILVREQSVAYVIDHSQSARSLSTEIEDWVRSSLKSRRPGDEASVVVLGKDAAVDMPPSAAPDWIKVQSVVSPDRTNLEKALQLASSILPSGKRRRILLVSDGQQNDGDALLAARNLALDGIRVDVLPVLPQKGQDVFVDRLDAPSHIAEGQQINLGVRLASNYQGTGRMRVYQGSSLVSDSAVSWEEGSQTYVVRVRPGRAGLHPFRVVLEAIGDGVASNNEASTVVNVLGKARVLVLTDKPRSAGNIVAALNAAGCDVFISPSSDAPQTPDAWNQYAFVVISEVSAQDFPDRAMETLEIAVRDLGKGVCMVGGEESFGPGGYFRTPIERVLPVYMDIRGKGEIPSLALMLVIDKSGSMSETEAGISKMDLAKEAAVRATEILGIKDVVGVVAFDGDAKWVVKPQNPVDLSKVQDDISSIRAGGGTNIYPGVAMAYEALKDQNTKYKHIILLTDGMSAYGGDYDALLRQAREAGITLSSVAVGSDSDTALLQRLARLGEGRYYFTTNTSSVPKIFTKETILASRDYFVEERFSPVATWRSPLIREMVSVPDLGGYVAATAKEMAQVVLQSHKAEPVLAQWQFGLGRAVAWTSDTGGRWTGEWIHSGRMSDLWRNISGWLVQPAGIPGFELVTSLHGDAASISLEMPVDSGITSVVARVVRPDQTAFDIVLEPTAPGLYKSQFEASEPGSYLVHVTPNAGQTAVGALSAGLAVQYSPEYKTTGANLELLREVARVTGGSLIDSPQSAWEQNLKPVFSGTPLWPYLLMLACFLLPLEVAARKLYIGQKEIRALSLLIRGTNKAGEAIEPAMSPSVAQLMKRRAESHRGLAGTGAAPKVGKAVLESPDARAGTQHRSAVEKRSTSPDKDMSSQRTIDTSRLLQKKRHKGDAAPNE